MTHAHTIQNVSSILLQNLKISPFVDFHLKRLLLRVSVFLISSAQSHVTYAKSHDRRENSRFFQFWGGKGIKHNNDRSKYFGVQWSSKRLFKVLLCIESNDWCDSSVFLTLPMNAFVHKSEDKFARFDHTQYAQTNPSRHV